MDVQPPQDKTERATTNQLGQTLDRATNMLNLPPERQENYLNRTWKKKLRWIMLALCMLYVVSVNFCIDYPASLEQEIEDGFNVSHS